MMAKPVLRVAATLFVMGCLGMTVAPTRGDDSAAPAATEAPNSIAATDVAKLKSAVGEEAVVEGTVDKAEWSKTGKVMVVTFDGVARKDFSVILFEKNKKKFDEGFNGDVAKTLTGAKVRFRGSLEEYKGGVEMKLTTPSQITLTEPPATKPAA